MDNHDAYKQFLRNHPLVKAALKSVDDEQKQHITELMDGFADQVANAFVPVIERAKKDPEFAELLRRQLRFGNKDVVIDGETFVSGSSS